MNDNKCYKMSDINTNTTIAMDTDDKNGISNENTSKAGNSINNLYSKHVECSDINIDDVSNSTRKRVINKIIDNINNDQQNTNEVRATANGGDILNEIDDKIHKDATENQNNTDQTANIKNDEQNNAEPKDITDNVIDKLGTTSNNSTEPMDITVEETEQPNRIIEDSLIKEVQNLDKEDNIFQVPIKVEGSRDGCVIEDNSVYNNVIILGSIVRTESAETVKRRRCKKELESLGIVRDQIESDEFDVDNKRSYKKYKLRDSERPDYRIPTGIFPPEPREEKQLEEEKYKEYPCTLCDHVSHYLGEFTKHVRFMHGLKYSCSLCSQTFESNCKLISHKAVHDKEARSFICHDCKVAFSNQYDYLVHKVTHSNNEIHKCVECNLSFGEDFTKHLATHFRPFITCEICSVVVQGKLNLQKHMKIHTSVERGYQCVECKKVLCDKSKFEMHMSLHTGVKSFQCLYCGKAFRTHGGKAVHTRIHNNERPFPCNNCDRAFKQSVDLHRHIAIAHTEAILNKFECDLCDKIFTFKTDLVMHKKSQHDQERLFQCPECDSRFNTMGALRGHVMFKHTDARPVECKYCNKHFINKNKYDHHSRSKVHKNNVYKFSLMNKN